MLFPLGGGPNELVPIGGHDVEHDQFVLKDLGIGLVVDEAQAGTASPDVIPVGCPVPVVPMALQGLWGSFFSRDPHKGFFRRLWSRVCLVAGQPVAPEAAQPEYLQEQVSVLRGERR